MKKVSLVVERYYQNNLVFNEEYNKKTDGRLNKLIALKNKFNYHNYDIATNDIIKPKSADVVIYYDTLNKNVHNGDISRRFLVLIESILVKPKLYYKKAHQNFNKIFTWNDNLVDNDHYIKINLAHKIPDKIDKNIDVKNKLCVMITTNRSSKLKNELYSERVNAINWFEDNQPNEFDLYGMGWNEYYINRSRPIRAFNKIKSLRKIMFKVFGTYHPSYRGKIESKLEIMKNYKFSICYENIRDVPGYITEKIFDAFFASCVPIYLGANNIEEYIPNNCYIDKRKYATYSELYSYISNMKNEKYRCYINNIEKFLISKKAHQFSDTHFANVIYNSVISHH